MRPSLTIIAVEGECDRALIETLFNLTLVLDLRNLITRDIKEVIESIKRITGLTRSTIISKKKNPYFYYIKKKDSDKIQYVEKLFLMFEYSQLGALQEILYDMLSILQHYIDKININIIIHKDCDTEDINDCKSSIRELIEKLNIKFRKRYKLETPKCECKYFNTSRFHKFIECKVECNFKNKLLVIHIFSPVPNTENVLGVKVSLSDLLRLNMSKYDICREESIRNKDELCEEVKSFCDIVSILDC